MSAHFIQGRCSKGTTVRENLFVGFHLLAELAQLVAVEKVGNVAVLLGFRDGELLHPGVGQELAHGPVDGGGRYQVLGGDMKVAVVLHHSGVLLTWGTRLRSNWGNTLPRLKRFGQLQGPVAPKIKEDNAVDRPRWFPGAYRLRR